MHSDPPVLLHAVDRTKNSCSTSVALGLTECLHNGPQTSCIIPISIHPEHLHRHEDKDGHGGIHERPIPCISLHNTTRTEGQYAEPIAVFALQTC